MPFTRFEKNRRHVVCSGANKTLPHFRERSIATVLTEDGIHGPREPDSERKLTARKGSYLAILRQEQEKGQVAE
jgi:hypothetical protein